MTVADGLKKHEALEFPGFEGGLVCLPHVFKRSETGNRVGGKTCGVAPARAVDPVRGMGELEERLVLDWGGR